MKKWMIALSAFALLGTASYADPQLINVNIDFEPRPEMGLDGPFDGDGGADLGTTWNQILGGPGFTGGLMSAPLFDSDNAPTGVMFSTSASHLFSWGAPSLTILTSAAMQFDNAAYEVRLSGLTPGAAYDLYIASFHPNENGGYASFSTPNGTTTSLPQVVDNGGNGGNDSTWVANENFALLENVIVDGSGEIVVGVAPENTDDRTKRAYVSGIQLVESIGACCTDGPGTESECIEVTESACGQAGPDGGLFLGAGTECINVLDCESLAVEMDSMSAELTRDGVLVRWTTALETDTVAFRILREMPATRGKSGTSMVVVKDRIPTMGNQLDGASYLFLDNSEDASRALHFYIEDMDVFGKVTRHGPIAIDRGTRAIPGSRGAGVRQR